MTRTQARLAELSAIRDRALTDEEQAEAYRLLRLERQCETRRQRYASDPAFRRTMIDRAVDWRRRRGATA